MTGNVIPSRTSSRDGASAVPRLAAHFLVGATASGKSRVAQQVAEEEGYAILSADSMLVYQGMDVGTAKPSRAERERVSYYGVDLVPPQRPFSVWQYREAAICALEKETRAGRHVLAVGGTGLYIKSLTDGLAPARGEHPATRDRWTRVFAQEGVRPLQEALKKRAPTLFDSVRDKKNARRLIRALELAEQGVKTVPRTWEDRSEGKLLIGLRVTADFLKSRIESRVAQMYRRGFVEEVSFLLAGEDALSATARHAIGYEEVLDFLGEKCSLEDAQEKTVRRTWGLAKRQLTWFAHQSHVTWVDVTPSSGPDEIAGRVLALWRKHGPTEIAG